MHQIRSLKGQLTHSQEKLEQLRHESALSRERLNKYSSDQSTRVEKLRGERQSLNSENNSLKAELADLKASIVAMNEVLAETRKECFELKSEREWEKKMEQKKAEEEEQDRLKNEAAAHAAAAKEDKAEVAAPPGGDNAGQVNEIAKTEEAEVEEVADKKTEEAWTLSKGKSVSKPKIVESQQINAYSPAESEM